MKAIKRLLVVDRDGISLGPLFKALFLRAAASDPVLSSAGIAIECAGINYGYDETVDGMNIRPEIANALTALNIQVPSEQSRDIELHPELIDTDIIIAASLAQEDGICLAFDDAWSKVVTLVDSKTLAGIVSFDLNSLSTTEEYLHFAEWVGPIIKQIVLMFKQSYSHAAIVKGICAHGGSASGVAYVARHGIDLVGFQPGMVLVIDRSGTLMYRSLNQEIQNEILKRLDPDASFSMVQEALKNFEAKLKGEQTFPKKVIYNVIDVVVGHATAVVCSRDDKYLKSYKNIPRLAYCIGATDLIRTGQRVVVDADCGVVYDASLL